MKKESYASSHRKKRIIVILLVVLLLITASAYGFMLGIKYADKNCKAEQDKNEIIDDDTNGENEETETPITKEEIESFLSLSVNGKPYYNLFELINNGDIDDSIFINTIRYLIVNDRYTKSNDNYVFKQSDVKEVARKYLMKDNFDYIPTYETFVYNSENQTFSVNFQGGPFGSDFTVAKEIQDYIVNGNKINVNYNITIFGKDPVTGAFTGGTTYSYAINIEKNDNELRIVNVVKN